MDDRQKEMRASLEREEAAVAAFFATNPPPCTGDYSDADEYDRPTTDWCGENGKGDLFGAV